MFFVFTVTMKLLFIRSCENRLIFVELGTLNCREPTVTNIEVYMIDSQISAIIRTGLKGQISGAQIAIISGF